MKIGFFIFSLFALRSFFIFFSRLSISLNYSYLEHISKFQKIMAKYQYFDEIS
jgi:hypothetical protein